MNIIKLSLLILFSTTIIGMTANANEVVQDVNKVLYTNEKAAILTAPDLAAELIPADSLEDGLPIVVTGVTSNYYRIDLGTGLDYYIINSGLTEQQITKNATANKDMNTYTNKDVDIFYRYEDDYLSNWARVNDLGIYIKLPIYDGYIPKYFNSALLTGVYDRTEEVLIPKEQAKDMVFLLLGVNMSSYIIEYNGKLYSISYDVEYLNPLEINYVFETASLPIKTESGQYICRIEPNIDFQLITYELSLNNGYRVKRKDWTTNELYIYLRDQLEAQIAANCKEVRVEWDGYAANQSQIINNLYIDILKAHPEYLGGDRWLKGYSNDVGIGKPYKDDGSMHAYNEIVLRKTKSK